MLMTFSAFVKVMHEMQVFSYFSFTPGSQGASHWGPPQRGPWEIKNWSYNSWNLQGAHCLHSRINALRRKLPLYWGYSVRFNKWNISLGDWLICYFPKKRFQGKMLNINMPKKILTIFAPKPQKKRIDIKISEWAL